MEAYKLLAKLRLLTLVGYEAGELLWMGTDEVWSLVPLEEVRILNDYHLSKI